MNPLALAPPDDADLELMLVIRRFEERLLQSFAQGVLHGTTHTCLGQEHVAVALRPFIRDDDFELSNHRGHGHYLARFSDLHGLLAELTGRQGAVCLGVGGSQHLFRPGQYLSTGIQGESLPVGVGVALRRRGKGSMVVVHVGDGTWGEGAAYEALNMAKLWRLPLLIAAENNHISQSTPRALQMAGDIEGRARAFGAAYARVESVDLKSMRAVISKSVQLCRAEPAPAVIEFDVRRLGPHSKGDDPRSPADLEAARAADWYPRYRDAFPEQVARLDERARARVSQVFDEVLARPLCEWKAGG